MVMSLVEYSGVFYRPLHPRPTILLITLCPGGRVNAMPASWNMPISEEPPTIGISVYKEAYTYQCLKHHPEATVNVPSQEHADLVYALGSVSGRSVDKVAKYGLRLIPSDTIKTPTWADALAVYETVVDKEIEVGEVGLFVLRVLKVKVKEGLVDKWGINLGKTNILLHGSGRVFYLVDSRRMLAKQS